MGLFDLFKSKKAKQAEAAAAEAAKLGLDQATAVAEKETTPKPAKKKTSAKKSSPEKPSIKKSAPKKAKAKKSSSATSSPKEVKAEAPTPQAPTPEVSTPKAPTTEEAHEEQPLVEQVAAAAETQPDAPAALSPAAPSPLTPSPSPEIDAPQETADDAKASAPKQSWFGRLKSGLGKSAQKITSSLAEAIGKPKLDASDLDDIEDALIMADLGVAAAGRLAQGLKKRPFPDGVTADSLAEALAEEVTEILAPVALPLTLNPDHKPHVVLMVGVNGSGKTTTAGKLAEQWQAEGKKVMMAAADTFRAAAVEQLKIWGERTGTTVISGAQGSDAAAVAYQAYETAIDEQADVLIVDTAGRLQAKAELMEELAKICRVIAKKNPDAPHDRVIVLDGTVGQNASSQVSAFHETAGLSGMIITKLDGSARGGVVVALAEAFGLPIHAVGVGEGKDDLRAFNAEDFGRALAGLGPKS